MKHRVIIFFTFFLSACAVGPDYVQPSMQMPVEYKEFAKAPDDAVWKIADPQDMQARGQWWLIFNDPQLNQLEDQLNISNQTIINAKANYQQAHAMVNEARAAFFPILTGSGSITRQRQTTSSITPSDHALTTILDSHSALLDASWEPDLWGSVRRNVEANVAGEQASAALLASTRLSVQALLAQSYFQLQALDSDQKILDDTVLKYEKLLQLTQHQYNAGVAMRADIVQAKTVLQTTQAQAINNGIARAQTEHAVSVLIGKPPAEFSLKPSPLTATPPSIPVQLPSVLLERRPDIAQAERLMAQANAKIGVAIAAYFPSITLSATGGFVGNGFSHWFSMPLFNWALSPQLAQTIFDGGARSAQVDAARAAYEASVASYRQTVLSAFQDVEDQLVALRILDAQSVLLEQAAVNAQEALILVINQYKAGTVAYASVANAEISAFTAQKNLADIQGLRMTTAVGLIKALGGGWKLF